MRQATKVKKARPISSVWQPAVLGRVHTPKQALTERELAFFFLDIRDFTPFIASRPAPEVMHLMQYLFKIFRQAIVSKGGTIIETAGDGFYAVFGLKESLPMASQSAVAAGYSIIQQVDWANHTYFSPFYRHSFRVGIGLHVGKGIIGKLGLGVKNQITIMGYAVNLAARLQQATKRLNNNFVVSAEAYQLLPQPPKATYQQISLKGVAEQMQVYLLGKAYAKQDEQVSRWKVAC